MIALIGDIHGEFSLLKERLKTISKEALVIQLGDFGYWPELVNRWHATEIDRVVHFIDGNHDHVPNLLNDGSTWPNAKYLPRGTVLEHDGLRIMCMGGSKSVDRSQRFKNTGFNAWFEEEQVRPRELQLAVAKGPVDILLTHTPPNSVKNKFLDRFLLKTSIKVFGVDPDTWIDESAIFIDKFWNDLSDEKGNRPQLYCGHMHGSFQSDGCRILDEGEVVIIDDK